MMRGSILLLICLCFASASGSRESTGVEERQGRISAISRQASLQPAIKTGDKLAGLRASGHLVPLLHSSAQKHLSLVSCLLPHLSRGFASPRCSIFLLWAPTSPSRSQSILQPMSFPTRKIMLNPDENRLSSRVEIFCTDDGRIQ